MAEQKTQGAAAGSDPNAAGTTGAQNTALAKYKGIEKRLVEARNSIQQILPEHMKAEMIIKQALASVMRDPLLLKCTPASILTAVIKAAELGLSPSSALGSAYLIPFNNHRKNCYECQMIPGYKGLIDLAKRSGDISSIEARAVHANEKFKIQFGTEQCIIHEPVLSGEAGEFLGVYAIARTSTNNSVLMEWMTKAEVNAIRARSKTSNNGPWKTDYEQMARKTIIRRIINYLPMSPKLARAIELDNDGERHESPIEGLDSGSIIIDGEVLDSSVESAPDNSRAAELKRKLAGDKADKTPAPPSIEEISLEVDQYLEDNKLDGRVISEVVSAVFGDSKSGYDDLDAGDRKVVLDYLKEHIDEYVTAQN
jgi:recombination protein RecT